MKGAAPGHHRTILAERRRRRAAPHRSHSTTGALGGQSADSGRARDSAPLCAGVEPPEPGPALSRFDPPFYGLQEATVSARDSARTQGPCAEDTCQRAPPDNPGGPWLGNSSLRSLKAAPTAPPPPRLCLGPVVRPSRGGPLAGESSRCALDADSRVSPDQCPSSTQSRRAAPKIVPKRCLTGPRASSGSVETSPYARMVIACRARRSLPGAYRRDGGVQPWFQGTESGRRVAATPGWSSPARGDSHRSFSLTTASYTTQGGATYFHRRSTTTWAAGTGHGRSPSMGLGLYDQAPTSQGRFRGSGVAGAGSSLLSPWERSAQRVRGAVGGR